MGNQLCLEPVYTTPLFLAKMVALLTITLPQLKVLKNKILSCEAGIASKFLSLEYEARREESAKIYSLSQCEGLGAYNTTQHGKSLGQAPPPECHAHKRQVPPTECFHPQT